MTYRVLTMLLLVVAVLAGYLAWTTYQRGNNLSWTLQQLEQAIAGLEAEREQLNQLPDKPLNPAESATGDFIVALRTEADLLGGTARIALPNDRVNWMPVRAGVVAAEFAVDIVSLNQAAPALLAMTADLIRSRPVKVKAAQIHTLADVTTMQVSLELYGRQAP